MKKIDDDLINIVYSNIIDRYVLVIKRFPDIPIPLFPHNRLNNIFNFVYNRNLRINGYDIKYQINDILYSFIIDRDSIQIKINKETITPTYLERNEIINKLLELREFLIEKGELKLDEK